MFLKTGSLWTPWIAHTLTNTALNLLHTVTADGMDGGMSLRMTAFSIVALPEVKAWREERGTQERRLRT